ncbi:hypothetical protein HMSSN139_32190 [Paenibacillus sp. HMSSN-139]|nr:hypothetical protein HMSSN139_32190 [Paenibacillus sp. HMSSN-139]
MLATLLHTLQGTPYIYQGEEIGMTNVRFESIDEYRDIETLNMYKEYLEKGRTPEEIMEAITPKGGTTLVRRCNGRATARMPALRQGRHGWRLTRITGTSTWSAR